MFSIQPMPERTLGMHITWKMCNYYHFQGIKAKSLAKRFKFSLEDIPLSVNEITDLTSHSEQLNMQLRSPQTLPFQP